jgi:hypothetical protein
MTTPNDQGSPYAPPPGPYGYDEPGRYPPPAQGTNGLAIASLAVGILWLSGVGSILAVIFGHIALGQIRRTGERGRGLAIAGLVVGYVGIVTVVLVIAAIAALSWASFATP